MKKLTKEQKEALLEKFGSFKNIIYPDIEAILSWNTEKEFPAFQVLGMDGDECLHVCANASDDSLSEGIFLDVGDDGITLDVSEFKKLAKGCQEIVEYIEEQNND